MKIGGPELFVNRLYRELKNYDLPPFKIINPDPRYVDYLYDKNIIKVGRLDGAMYYKITSRNLYNLIKQRKTKLAPIFALLKYLPNSFTLPLNSMVNNYLNRFCKIVQQKSDIIVFQSKLSKRMQELFVGGYYAEKPNIVILNGVPTEVFNPDVEPIPLEGYPRLAITASFRLHKRLQDAVAITNYLRKEFPNMRLHAFGDMDVLTKEHIRQLDLSSTILHGRIDSTELPGFYNSCEVGLSLTMFDPCPNSVVEMMACGLPVITNKESGAAELLNVGELIIPERVKMGYYELQTVESLPQVNIKVWAEKIKHVLEHRKYYSELMLDRVKKELDIRVVAKKYANFIKEYYYGK